MSLLNELLPRCFTTNAMPLRHVHGQRASVVLRVGGVMALTACCAAAGFSTLAAQAGTAQPSADAPPLTTEAARALKNPIANTSKSVARGKGLYGALGCANCHGTDGKALIEVVANATDLTEPQVWKNGTDEGLIFRSIRDGAGLVMPPFKAEVTSQEDMWHLVNFVRSLWPAAQRPPLSPDPGH